MSQVQCPPWAQTPPIIAEISAHPGSGSGSSIYQTLSARKKTARFRDDRSARYQPLDALCAHASELAFIGTDSLISRTGTTLTSFQKLYFATKEVMILGSLASTRT